MATLGDAWVGIHPGGFADFAAAAKAGIQAALAGIKPVVDIGADTKPAVASVTVLKAQIDALAKTAAKFLVDADTGPATRKMAALLAQLNTLSKTAAKIDVGVEADSTPLLALQARLLAVAVGMDEVSKSAAEAKAATAAAAAAADAASAETGKGLPLWQAAGTAFAVWGFNLGGLGGKLQLFGGALRGLTAGFPATVGGFHLLTDAVLETAAVVVPAGVALGAFGVAAASTVNDIVNSEKAMFTVTTALGTAFPGLSSGLQHFTDSVKPQVYVLFGAALGVINAHTGLFSQLATGAGDALDQLAVRAQLALGGDGLHGLIAKGVSDLQLLGNIIGNVFGIFGNVLKSLPGIAEQLFRALQDITGALEAVTGSGIVQGLLNIGLALHGAVLWGGLAVTAFVALTRIGLVSWIAGVVTGLADLVGALIAGEAAMVIFDAVMAVNPLYLYAVAIGLVVAGLTALVVWLTSSKSAADQLWDSIEKNVTAATTFAQANQALSQGMQQVNAQLASTPKYINAVTDMVHGQAQAVDRELNPAWVAMQKVQGQTADQQQVLSARMTELDKITGSQANTLADLNSLNVKAGSIATDTAGQYATLKTQIQDLATATVQLAGYTAGPAAAAQNALTNLWLNEQLPAIQKITQAEQNLLNVVTGGQTAFNDFQQSIQGTTAKFVSPSGLADAAQLAKGNLTGLGEQSLAFSNTLYTQAIPGLSKLIGSLQQQSATTAQLTTVTATGAGQILDYTGKNTEARSVIVDLINNALGPGTVSLQTLNTWVAKNSTTLQGMNSIVAQSTIQAGSLAEVLESQLTAQFHQMLLQTSGADTALKIYTGDITSNQAATVQGRSDRLNLINDLEKAGLSAQDATKYVNSLSGAIKGIPSATDITIKMTGDGTYSITGPGQVAPYPVKAAASGLYLHPNMGTPGRDSVLVRAMPGELIVPTNLVPHVAHALGGKIPGFADGGTVSGNLTPAYITGMYSDFQKQFTTAMVTAMQAGVTAATQLAAGTRVPYSGVAGVTQWESDVSRALSMLGLPQADLPTVMAQMQTESGGNPNAINLTDINAQMGDPSRGLMQVIGTTFAAFRSPSLSANIYDPMANIYAGINYAIHRYGNPGWLSVLGQGHGYALGGLIPSLGFDQGGVLPPGYTMAYNGTGQPETVTPGGGAQPMTSAQGAELIRELRRNTQAVLQQGPAFGRALNGTLTRGYYGR